MEKSDSIVPFGTLKNGEYFIHFIADLTQQGLFRKIGPDKAESMYVGGWNFFLGEDLVIRIGLRKMYVWQKKYRFLYKK
ncbi:MAG: hypothetical protein V1686_02005 [Patescibacteria group bacterium]